MSTRQRVAVVTGGGGGIGRAIAEELGRGGWFVVTVDPLVTVDGTERLPDPAETTAGRIVAAGGSARASSASVTDAGALHDLFGELAAEHGGLDAVVNVAGITRQSYLGRGSEEDWRSLLAVHLDGYLNVLHAALPLMAAAEHGRILGVTSGSGWRAADAGGYSHAKRVVAALTWQLGRCVPPGVAVNAISPIAYTRMVVAALERARAAGKAGGGGGLSLSASMPGPEDLGPLGAHLVGDGAGWCNGQVLFTAGSEVAVVDQPRLLEVVRTDGVTSLAAVLEAVVPGAFVTAETAQASSGGTNPRFGPIFGQPASATTPPTAPTRTAAGAGHTCAVVGGRPGLTASLIAALEGRSVACHLIEPARGFDAATGALRSAAESAGPFDAVVTVPNGQRPTGPPEAGWEQVLEDHRGITDELHGDASWVRAVADYAAGAARPVQLVTLTDATGPAGRSRAQAAAQLARVAGSATEGRVTAFAAGLEAAADTADGPASELVAHLLCTPDVAPLAGAELVVGTGWIGLRSHPRPVGTVVYGGPAVPAWLDGALGEIASGTRPAPHEESR